MGDVVLGQALGDCHVFVKRASKQNLALDWYNDEAQTVPSNLTGVTMVISLGDRDAPTHVWTATNTANRSLWALTEADTDLDLTYYGGVLTMNDGSGEVLLFRIQVEVED